MLSDHCKNKRKISIAKMKKALLQNKNNVIKMIQVLSHAVRKG
jgi:hypothetical protein